MRSGEESKRQIQWPNDRWLMAKKIKQLFRKQIWQRIWGWLNMEDDGVKEDTEATQFHFLGQFIQEETWFWGKKGKGSLKKKLVCCCCLQPHGLQHARLPYPSNSCPLSRWRFLTISSSAAIFFCLQKTSYNLLSLRDSKDKKVYICLRKVETGVLSLEEGSGMEGGRGPVGRSWVIRINMLCCGKEKTDSKSFSFGLDIRR